MRLFPSIEYPKAHRALVTDVLHGVQIDDPYRWLEDPDTNETKAFIREQNDISTSYISDCYGDEKFIDMLYKTVGINLHNKKFTVPDIHGEYKYFFAENGEARSVMFRVKGKNASSVEEFLNPNKFSNDSSVVLSDYYVSETGNYMAYLTSVAGSDWRSLHVRDTQTIVDLPDKLERLKFTTVSWTHDDKGFFYAQYPDSKDFSGRSIKSVFHQKLYYHKLGAPQDEDKVILEYPEQPEWSFKFSVSSCGQYFIVEVSKVNYKNNVLIAPLNEKWNSEGKLSFKTMYGAFDCSLVYAGSLGSDFFFYTDKDRPNKAIVKMNFEKPELLVDVIKEDLKRPMIDMWMRGGDKFLIRYLQDARSVIEIISTEGEILRTLNFDFEQVYVGKGKQNSSIAHLQTGSFTIPMSFYQFDMNNVSDAKLELIKQTKFSNFDPNEIEVKQEFYNSKDGTRIPMFIFHRANQTLDGSAPGYINVYGGFDQIAEPAYSLFYMLMVLSLGFVVSVPNVRGGGEYGRIWHEAGKSSHKQNTIDDVHAAALFLAQRNYTSLGRIVLHGGSNGGFVTLASVNQRPELFGAALSDVAVTDLLRFKKFTIGHRWTSDFGDPDNATDFEFIRRLSPLHNIPSSIDNYPALYMFAGDHDDRVVPSHSLKFLAEIQHKLGKSNKKPLLGYIQRKVGHGSGMTGQMASNSIYERICFLSKSMDLKMISRNPSDHKNQSVIEEDAKKIKNSHLNTAVQVAVAAA